MTGERGLGTPRASEPPVSMGRPDLDAIRAYYDATWWDYRWLWLNNRNQAIHFGYWDAQTRTHSESLVNMNRALAERIGIRAGQCILDAGCGIGGSALWLAAHYDVEVVGITPVAGQVARARRAAARRGCADRVTFLQQDYTGTDFPTASFDVVWAVESACHAPDKRAFLREACRLLRPGGRLGMVEYMRTGRPFAPANEALLHSWLSGWAIPDIASPDEWTCWTRDSGFTDILLADITPNVRPSLLRLHRMTQLLYPGASLLRALRLRTPTQHGNIRGARNQYRALRRGLWMEALLTATTS